MHDILTAVRVEIAHAMTLKLLVVKSSLPGTINVATA
jgi:hypothetical protein